MTAWVFASCLLLAPPAQLRIAQALPLDELVTVNILQGEEPVAPAVPLRGGEASGYLDVPAGRLTVTLTAGEQAAGGTVDLSAGGRFTLVAHRFLGEPFMLLRDDATAPAADAAVVRFVQAVPDRDLLRLRWRRPRGTAWRDEPGDVVLAYPAAGEYQTLAPGPVTLRLLTPHAESGELETVEEFQGLRLLPGVRLTVIVCGLDGTEGDQDLPLTLLALIDASAVSEG